MKNKIIYPTRNLGLTLFDVGVFKDKRQSLNGKGFKLKLHDTNPNAPLSPFYLNIRTPENKNPGPLTKFLVKTIGIVLFYHAFNQKIKYDSVVGLPTAGDPLALSFVNAAYDQKKIILPILNLEKVEGDSERKIVAPSNADFSGKHPLVIDDLITKSHSKEEAIKALEEKGAVVKDVIVLVDREQGGSKQLAKAGYNLHSVFQFSVLLDWYLAEGKINKDLYQEIKEYLAVNS